MMSRQETVPPVKRETGYSAVVTATFSLGNNQTQAASTGISAQSAYTKNLRACGCMAKVWPPVKR